MCIKSELSHSASSWWNYSVSQEFLQAKTSFFHVLIQTGWGAKTHTAACKTNNRNISESQTKHLKFPWSRSDEDAECFNGTLNDYPLWQSFLVSSFCHGSSISFFNFISKNDSNQRLFISFFFDRTRRATLNKVSYLPESFFFQLLLVVVLIHLVEGNSHVQNTINSAIKSING